MECGVSMNIFKSKILLLALYVFSIHSLEAKKAKSEPEDLKDVYRQVMKLYKHGYDNTPGLKDFREVTRRVIENASRNEPPVKILHKGSFIDSPSSLADLKFCESGKYERVARLYNQVAKEPDPASKNSMLAGMISCMAGKESSDYWNSKRLLKELWPDKKESGSGVLGVFQLDKKSSEGNQSLCIGQFKRWEMTNYLKMKSTNVGPSYADAPDQRYNIACGTYFNISAWLSSQKRNGGCADVVPKKDTQFGSLGEYKFEYCVNQMSDFQNVAVIKNGFYELYATENKTFKAKNHYPGIEI